MARHYGSMVFGGALAVAGCQSAQPVRPLAPLYPTMLRSAGYGGRGTVTVRVDRHGHPSVVPSGPGEAAGGHPLFLQAIAHAVRNTGWRPARRFGFPHADSSSYEFMFVIVKDTSPLGSDERYVPGNDTLPKTCPRPLSPQQIVVCSAAGHVGYHVLY